MRLEQELQQIHAMRCKTPVSCVAEVLYTHLIIGAKQGNRYDVADAYLLATMGISPYKLRKAREELVHLGLITYESEARSKYNRYTLLRFSDGCRSATTDSQTPQPESSTVQPAVRDAEPMAALYAYYKGEFAKHCPDFDPIPPLEEDTLDRFTQMIEILQRKRAVESKKEMQALLSRVCRMVAASELLSGRAKMANGAYWTFRSIVMLDGKFIIKLLNGHYDSKKANGKKPSESKIFNPNEGKDAYEIRSALLS